MKRAHKMVFGLAAAFFLVLPVVLAMIPSPASGTDTMMQVLPASSKFRCNNCHATSTPVIANAALNTFGSDFKANGNLWNITLAEKNSDGDKCTNGFELGDADGDGVFDFAGVPLESSNPGFPDCTLPVDEATWGVIKTIFGNEFQDFSGYYGPLEIDWVPDFDDYRYGDAARLVTSYHFP